MTEAFAFLAFFIAWIALWGFVGVCAYLFVNSDSYKFNKRHKKNMKKYNKTLKKLQKSRREFETMMRRKK